MNKRKLDLDLSDSKRAYITQFEKRCSCGNLLVTQEDAYVSYPEVGDTFHAYFYCNACETIYEIPFTITNIYMEVTFDSTEMEVA